MQNDTAERIMDVAHGLMVQRGYSAFSYADIAEAIQIRKPSIHHHFPAKAGLAVAVLQRHRERLEAGLAQLDEKVRQPWERLHQYVSYWEACIRDQKEPFCVAALLAAEMPSLPEEVQAEVRKHFEVLHRWLSSTLKLGVKDGTIRLQENAETEAEMLMAAVHGGMMSARVTGSAQMYKSITTGAVKRLREG